MAREPSLLSALLRRTPADVDPDAALSARLEAQLQPCEPEVDGGDVAALALDLRCRMHPYPRLGLVHDAAPAIELPRVAHEQRLLQRRGASDRRPHAHPAGK